MKPDFEEHWRKAQQGLINAMNQTSADFGSPHRIRADGTSCYDYSSTNDDQILDDVGGIFISEEQRHEATQAIISRLDGVILEQGAAEQLHGKVVSLQAGWIKVGAGFLSKPENRTQARAVLGLLDRVDTLLPKQQPDETQTTDKGPHQDLIERLRANWHSVKKNSLGISTQEQLDNADDALQFLSEVKST